MGNEGGAVVMESIVVREGMGRGDHTGHTKECQKRAQGTRNNVFLGDDFGAVEGTDTRGDKTDTKTTAYTHIPVNNSLGVEIF